MILVISARVSYEEPHNILSLRYVAGESGHSGRVAYVTTYCSTLWKRVTAYDTCIAKPNPYPNPLDQSD